jgi:Stage II sporulation protein E (SpoIIE)
VTSCLVDGYSSAGTRGNGLGAVIRQSNFFDIASWPGIGTAVLARVVGRAGGKRHHPASTWGAVSIAMRGQDVCGDSWTVSQNAGVVTLFVADGLGHGQEAAEAAVEAVRLFHRFNGHQVATLLEYVHGGLRSRRGAAVSMARFDRATGRVVFGGIGNVAGALSFDGTLKRMVSMPGTAGHNARKVQSFDYPFQSGLVILASDGLSANLTLARYPKLEASHPTLIAAILYRDFGRNRDDATVVVGKWPAKGPLESDAHP